MPRISYPEAFEKASAVAAPNVLAFSILGMIMGHENKK